MLSTADISIRTTAATGLRHVAAPVRFVAAELALFASIYVGYLAVRSSSVGSRGEAVANARDLIALEQAAGLSYEAWLQGAASALHGFFSAYYMLGFGPVILATAVWMATRRRDVYRRFRTVLLVSIAIATIGYVAYPAAPPRMIPELGIADTVGLSGSHDEGSFAGVKFNPYAAMPSMHVGWSLVVGIFGYQAARRRFTKALFAAHPAIMAVTVTATGNHYFVDSIAGALVALTAVGVVYLAAQARPVPALVAATRRRLAAAPALTLAPAALPAPAAATARTPAASLTIAPPRIGTGAMRAMRLSAGLPGWATTAARAPVACPQRC
jgi:hypothetical protein